MMIIGCDFHPSWQQVSWLDAETGECGERKLVHATGDAQVFYQQLVAPALIGMEATGNSQWFIELVQDLGHEIWIGDAAQIRASYVRKQKTDKRDAAHILKLVVGGFIFSANESECDTLFAEGAHPSYLQELSRCYEYDHLELRFCWSAEVIPWGWLSRLPADRHPSMASRRRTWRTLWFRWQERPVCR